MSANLPVTTSTHVIGQVQSRVNDLHFTVEFVTLCSSPARSATIDKTENKSRMVFPLLFAPKLSCERKNEAKLYGGNTEENKICGA